MDIALSERMDLVAKGILSDNTICPTLADNDKTIIRYLSKFKKPQLLDRLTNKVASNAN
ncbi:MAG: hypothetical protein IH802_11305 [Nitrospinae bacterium]|nr:hypothetical protein [Nitrospinota bacterium]